jgi:hypothetical protein
MPGFKLPLPVLACVALASLAALEILTSARVGADTAAPTLRNPGRWRGNAYIRDDGLLPFQLCDADKAFPGPRRSAAGFSQDGREYRAVLTAASVWGESLPQGQPLRADAVELLMFFFEAGKSCPYTSDPPHCVLPPVSPRVACQMMDRSWHSGSIKTHRSVAVVRCPVELNTVLPDSFDVILALGDRATDVLRANQEGANAGSDKGVLSASICYEHVEAVDDLVICTCPHFFDEASGYWHGVPPYPGGSTLLEAFLLHNLYVVNASRLAMYDLESSMRARLSPFLAAGGKVKYRANWALRDELPLISFVTEEETLLPGQPRLTGVSGKREMFYAFEAQAEATCAWEHRIRARWFQILHGVDNFLMPMCFGCNVTSVLARVDAAAISEIRVPIVEAFSPSNDAFLDRLNVMQRFRLIAETHFLARDGRQTPIGNPRHFDESWIHDLTGKRVTARGAIHESASLELGLHSVHIMALSRPERDTHIGIADEWFAEAGQQLARLLQMWEVGSILA